MDLWSNKKSAKHTSNKSYTSTASSDYSTCSDAPIESSNTHRDWRMSTQSVILAGSKAPDNILEDSNYTINFLDQRLDLSEDDEKFMDCTGESRSIDQSTMYLPLGLAKKKSKNFDDCSHKDEPDLQILEKNGEIDANESTNLSPMSMRLQSERLVTIVEEKEVTLTTDSMILRAGDQNTGKMLAEIVSQMRDEKIESSNKNSTKRVLFANENDVSRNDKQVCSANESASKKQQKISNSLCKKVGCFVGYKNDRTDENCNNKQNTTESFIYWEKLCQTSGLSTTRRSLSFSELNSMSESCGGDDEYSSSYKTLEEYNVSHLSLESVDTNHLAGKHACMQRSKSCNDLLKEVKHLRHVLYDRFLKWLAEEIEKIRKQKTVCTCQKPEQKMNKDNQQKTSKTNAVRTNKNLKAEVMKKDSKSSLTVSPCTVVTSQSRLSPEVLKNSSRINQRLSPKSPNKTSITPSKVSELYSWHKEIVSPVGEYIRGKRLSPYRSSPNKRKV